MLLGKDFVFHVTIQLEIFKCVENQLEGPDASKFRRQDLKSSLDFGDL